MQDEKISIQNGDVRRSSPVSDPGGDSGGDGPLSGQERTSRLVKLLPNERALWRTLHYFPFSASWDEERQKQLAVEHTQSLFVPKYTNWYKQREINRLQQQVGTMNARPPPPSSSTVASHSNRGGRNNMVYPSKKNKRSSNNKRRRYYDPDDEDEDYDAYDEEQMIDQDEFARAVARSSLRQQNEEATRNRLDAEAKRQIEPYLDFLRALPECEPLTAGFVLLPVSSGSQKCCFCPCNYRLRKWRTQCVWKNTDSDSREKQPPHPQPEPETFRPCGNAGKSTLHHAPGLVAHVSELKEGDWWHWLIYEYLNRLFRHYMGSDRPHKALLPPNSRKYNATERLEYLAVGAHIQSLSESEEAHKKKLANLRLKTTQLETHCKHLAKSLDKQRRSEAALRNILAASWESFSPTEVSDKELRQYQTRRDNYFSMVRKTLPTEKLLSGMRLSVVQGSFNMQTIFEANATLFLNDLPRLGDAAYWLRPMEIQYEAPETGSKLQKTVEKDMSAIDRGGPTRQFLSEAFESLAKLRVKCANEETELWVRDEKTGFYFPQEDETILYNLRLLGMDGAAALKKVRSVARAVGRLIFYCMANVVEKDGEYQTADQRLHVDAFVLPEIYLYYLLADVKPSSHEYPLGDLVKFVSKHRLMSEKDWEWDEDTDFDRMKAGLHTYMSAVLEEQPRTDHDLHESIQELREGLRRAAEKDFIDNRKIVLSALREGMSLDNSLEYIDMRMMVGRAPVEVIRRMFLSMPSCNFHNVINCLEPKYNEEYPQYLGFQKQLLRITDNGERAGLLPDVLISMSKDDQDVARKFMFFATGMRYTPYQDDTFRILIEFTFSAPTAEDQGVTDDMLPWAHTCPRDVLIPGFAYHGDRNLLQEKLKKVLEYANSFDMN